MSAISPNRKCMLEKHSAAGRGGSRFSRIKGIFLRLQKMHSCAHSLCTVILAEECYRNNLISLKGWNLPFYSSTNAKRILQICFQFSIQILSTEVRNRNFVRLAIFPSLGAAPRVLYMPYTCTIFRCTMGCHRLSLHRCTMLFCFFYFFSFLLLFTS